MALSPNSNSMRGAGCKLLASKLFEVPALINLDLLRLQRSLFTRRGVTDMATRNSMVLASCPCSVTTATLYLTVRCVTLSTKFSAQQHVQDLYPMPDSVTWGW